VNILTEAYGSGHLIAKLNADLLGTALQKAFDLADQEQTMKPSVRNMRVRIPAVALAALISFGGLSTVAAPAHADGIFAQVLPQVLFGNREGDTYRRAEQRDEQWHRRREREQSRGYYRRNDDRRWQNNGDEGHDYRRYERGD